MRRSRSAPAWLLPPLGWSFVRERSALDVSSLLVLRSECPRT